MSKYIRLDQLAIHYPEYLDALKDLDSMIVCRNKETQTLRTDRFSSLYHNNKTFWSVKESIWDFYIRKDFLDKLQKDPISKKRIAPETEVKEILGIQYEEITKMTPENRNRKMEDTIEKVESVLHQKKASSKEISEVLIDSSIYSALINKVSLEESLNMENSEAKSNASRIAKKTEVLMDSLIEVISRDFDYSDALVVLEDKTSGLTLKHMTRVFVMTMSLMDFINNQIEYSGLNTRIIGMFDSYRPLYEPLFRKLNTKEINIHKLVMEPIKFSEGIYRNICLGMMLHDIGKKRNIDYFESGESYQRETIESHAFDGYFMIMRRNIYQEEIAAMAGMHHEYYGHESGYGVYRENYEEYIKTGHHQHKFSGIMTMDYGKIRNFQALAYLPAKILEIIDVYDALTDKAREYKTQMSPVEALKLMKSEMIVNHLKLDPILFDLFVRFLKSKNHL